MKWVRIIIAIGFVGVLAYYSFHPLPDFALKIGDTLLPVSKEEKEVRDVFAHYTALLMRGDTLCENIYMPNAAFQVVDTGPHGDPRGRAVTPTQHRTLMQQILARIRAGELHFHFSDVQCRELPDGKVRLSCKEFINDGPGEHLSMVFVSTAPQRWAVSEETRHFGP